MADLWPLATEAANLHQLASKHQGWEHPGSLTSSLNDVHHIGASKGQPKRELTDEVYKLPAGFRAWGRGTEGASEGQNS